MSRIRSANTSIELLFRRYVWQKGLRGYRIKNKITGKPDLYFPVAKIAVFIDGCFWHKCPEHYVEPKSNLSYWLPKIERNIIRDREINRMLQISEIRVIRIWEHEIRENAHKAYEKIARYKNSKSKDS